jgi:hypothetical protein
VTLRNDASFRACEKPCCTSGCPPLFCRSLLVCQHFNRTDRMDLHPFPVIAVLQVAFPPSAHARPPGELERIVVARGASQYRGGLGDLKLADDFKDELPDWRPKPRDHGSPDHGLPRETCGGGPGRRRSKVGTTRFAFTAPPERKGFEAPPAKVCASRRLLAKLSNRRFFILRKAGSGSIEVLGLRWIRVLICRMNGGARLPA